MKAVGLFVNLTHCYWERYSPWQKYSLLGGVCWQYQWWVFPFVFQDAPNTHSRGKAFRSLPHHRPIRHHLSRLLCCFLPWLKAAALWYELLFLHISLSIACVQLTQEKKHYILFPAATCEELSRLSTVYVHSSLAEPGREGWETTKHIRPNYSAGIRAFLSCSGYLLLTVRVVWLK